jgi:C_GCAxxG_C_C family probable redox protein
MDPIDRAKENYAQGFSCSQSVFVAFAEEMGVDRETAAKIAAGFGGGMGRSGRTCGAVSGALMAVGLARGTAVPTDKATKEQAYASVRKVLEAFEARHGTLDCSSLLGADIGTPEGHALAREKGLFSRCARYVESAAEITVEILK